MNIRFSPIAVLFVCLVFVCASLNSTEPAGNDELKKFSDWIKRVGSVWDVDVISGKVTVDPELQLESVFEDVPARSRKGGVTEELMVAIRANQNTNLDVFSACLYYINRFDSIEVDKNFDGVVLMLRSEESGYGGETVALPKISKSGKIYGVNVTFERFVLVCLSRRYNSYFTTIEDYLTWRNASPFQEPRANLK